MLLQVEGAHLLLHLEQLVLYGALSPLQTQHVLEGLLLLLLLRSQLCCCPGLYLLQLVGILLAHVCHPTVGLGHLPFQPMDGGARLPLNLRLFCSPLSLPSAPSRLLSAPVFPFLCPLFFESIHLLYLLYPLPLPLLLLGHHLGILGCFVSLHLLLQGRY